MKAARDACFPAVVINAGSRRGRAHELAVDTMRKAGVPISARFGGGEASALRARGGVCRDGARVPLPWTENAALSHGFSLTEAAAEPWLPAPADWGIHAVERQQQDPAACVLKD